MFEITIAKRKLGMNQITVIKNKIKEVVLEFTEKDFFQKTNVLSFICLCLFILDCCVMGGGRYFEIMGVSVRMILGALSILFALPTLFRDWKKHFTNPFNIMILFFALWSVFCAVRGIINQNNQVTLISDIKGFMYLFLIPIALNCVTSKKRMNIILDMILIGAFLQSILVFGINVYCSVDLDNIMNIYYPVMDIQLGTVSVISHSIYRIFMRSAPYVIVACVIAIYRQIQCDKAKTIYSILTAIYLNTILLSYTRSLFGSAGITAILVIITAFCIYPKRIKVLIKHLVVTLLCVLILVGTEEIVFEANYLNFAISRTFGIEPRASFTSKLCENIEGLLEKWFNKDISGQDDDSDADEMYEQELYLDMTVASDEVRKITQRELIDLIKKQPLIGNGLGACSQTRNGPDEYFYLDVLARMGIVGMALYALPYLYIIYKALKNKRFPLGASLCLPFWIATAFNPWMNAAIGISCYAISLVSAERNEVS